MPTDHDVTICGTCAALIRWTVTAAGKRLPVDAEPSNEGNLAVYTDGVGRVRSRGLTKERPTLEHNEWQAMPHFATCTRPPARRSSSAPQRRRTGVRPVPWQGWQR